MTRRIAIILVSFASVAGADDGKGRLASLHPTSPITFEVVLVPASTQEPESLGPAVGDLKSLGRPDLEELRRAGIDPGKLTRSRAGLKRRLYKDRSGEVYALPVRHAGRRAQPAAIGVNLRALRDAAL